MGKSDVLRLITVRLSREGINAVGVERLPGIKGYKANVKLILGSQPLFCEARKTPLPLQDMSKKILRKLYDRASWSQYNLEGSQMHHQ